MSLWIVIGQASVCFFAAIIFTAALWLGVDTLARIWEMQSMIREMHRDYKYRRDE